MMEAKARDKRDRLTGIYTTPYICNEKATPRFPFPCLNMAGTGIYRSRLNPGLKFRGTIGCYIKVFG